MTEKGKDGGDTENTKESKANVVSPDAGDANLLRAVVRFLDASEHVFCLQKKAEGHELYAMVVERLQLLEKEYFSLLFTDADNVKHWLNEDKQISKQVKGKKYEFQFEVKFYPPDPTLLTDDIARHLVYLQICRDLDTGRLPVSMSSCALLGSFIAQIEMGEYDLSNDYLALVDKHLFMKYSEKVVEKIRDLHKQHRGKTPSEAEICFLDSVKRLALYGIEFFGAKSTKGYPVRIGISAHGIDVYREQVRLHRFLWQNIVKIAFHWNVFEIKLRHGELEKSNSVDYKLPNYDSAKRVWKCAVENHTFFRLIQPDEKPHKKLFRWGSAKFRYQGRTQFQSKMASQMFDHPSATLPRDQSLNLSYGGQSLTLQKTPQRHSFDNIPSGTNYDPKTTILEEYEILQKDPELPVESLSLESDAERKKPNEDTVIEEEGTSEAANEVISQLPLAQEATTDGDQEEDSSLPHTTVESYHEGEVGPAYVVTDVDQHGNIIRTTTKTQHAKHTVQKQTYQTYTIPNEGGEMGIQTVEASQQLLTPIGEAAVVNGTTPIIETHSHVVSYESTDPVIDEYNMSDLPGELISSRTITSGNRTFETVTYKTEKNGIIETHVEHRVTIHSKGDIDHDAELCQAILEATDMNPDMTVEKIEVRQESQS